MGEPRTGVGDRVQRREDAERVTGSATYIDDIALDGMAHAAIHRSDVAHGRIESVDTAAAERAPGVIAVYSAKDLAADGVPGVLPAQEPEFATVPDRPLLAADRVRFEGEPIALVVAEDRYAAHEGCGRIEVEYERLPTVVDPIEALSGGPTLHEAAPDNCGVDWELGDAEATAAAFEAAATTVDVELVNNRVVPTPMEPRGVLARPGDSPESVHVEMTTQHVHRHREGIAGTLGLAVDNVEVRAPDVGGGFGAKMQHYPAESLVSWAALETGSPVKWQAPRREEFRGTIHGRDHFTWGELALAADGTIRGLRVETVVNLGGYASTAGTLVPTQVYGPLLCGQYDVPTMHLTVTGAFTNTTPTDAYRGAGRPEANYVIERLAHVAARECRLSPVTFRRRNFVPAEAFPYESATGAIYDSGDYEAALSKALELADYESLRERRGERREAGEYVGVGLGCYVESSGSAPGRPERARVRVEPSGTVTAAVGTTDQGQGHGTTYAQIVAERLGIDYDRVRILEGDTTTTPEGGGTSGSRSAPVGGGALAAGVDEVRERIRRIAAAHFDVNPAEVVVEGGSCRVVDSPDRHLTLGRVAALAAEDGEADGGLAATATYDPENYTFTFGAHVAAVSVDAETGDVEIERYVAVDDAGVRINPTLIEGQIHGGVVQGIGQALFERVVYDEAGRLISGSMASYAIPSATDVPTVETGATETPSPHNPLGAKGVGEAGAIAAPAAVVNAVADALRPLGVEGVGMPLTAESVWREIQAAEGGE